MLTAKSPFSQKTEHAKSGAERHQVMPHAVGTGYHRLELLLVGFASVFITFLWVGVFSVVLQDRAVRIPSLGNSTVAAAVRNAADFAGVTAAGMLGAGSIARDSILYQFTAIWESSCVTQQTCIGGLQAVSQKTVSVIAIVDNIAANSEFFITFVRDASSFRVGDAGTSLAKLTLPGTVYASGVLGEKTISPEVLMQKGVTEYYQYVDSMTFGLVTVISPELTQDVPSK